MAGKQTNANGDRQDSTATNDIRQQQTAHNGHGEETAARSSAGGLAGAAFSKPASLGGRGARAVFPHQLPPWVPAVGFAYSVGSRPRQVPVP